MEFRVGSRRVDLHPLSVMLSFIQSARIERPSLGLKPEFAAGALMDAEDLFQNRRRLRRDIISLLETQRHRKCLDALDKVFSLLSLARRDFQISIAPDYSQSVQWVYCMSVKACIAVFEKLDILRESMSFDVSNSLPSWCPDWTMPQSRSRLGSYIPTESTTKISFSDDLKTMFPDRCTLIDSVDNLHIQQSDEDFEWEFHEDGSRCNWDLHAGAQQLDGLRRVFGQAYFTKQESTLEALLRTLVADLLPSGGRIRRGLSLDMI